MQYKTEDQLSRAICRRCETIERKKIYRRTVHLLLDLCMDFNTNCFEIVKGKYIHPALQGTCDLMKDFEGKVDSKELGEIKGKIMELKELLKPDKKDIPALRKKLDEVNQLVQKASTELYQKASQQQASHGSQEGKSGKKDDNVVDADYEVKDEKKKK